MDHRNENGWRTSGQACALSDGDRHIGHVLKIGARWHAFDATQSNEMGNGFRSLGVFTSPEAGQRAVEQSYRLSGMSFAGAA